MLSGYAARDHRQIVIKQRRPDQGSRNKPSDGSYRVDSHQHPPLFRFASTRVDALREAVRYRGKMLMPSFLF